MTATMHSLGFLHQQQVSGQLANLPSIIIVKLCVLTYYSNFFAPLLGGLLASFLSVPMCAVVIAEAMFSLVSVWCVYVLEAWGMEYNLHLP